MATPAKDKHTSRFNASGAENSNPNLSSRSPLQKKAESPVIKSSKSKKSAPKLSYQIVSPRTKIQERKFVVAKKKPKATTSVVVSCKCKVKMGGDLKKCPCIAYENLRASQEEFFRNEQDIDFEESQAIAEVEQEQKTDENFETTADSLEKSMEGNESSPNGSINYDQEEFPNEMGSSKIKRRRERLLEAARSSIPEAGSGRVKHMVKAFERIFSIPRSNDTKENEEEENGGIKKPTKWALPGLQPKALETEASPSSVSPSELFFTSENFGSDSRVSSSSDSSQGSFTFTSRKSEEGGARRNRSRRNSSESSASFGGKKWKKKQLKVTSQQPFKLRTEQRGRFKEEEFLKKMQEMSIQEERQRIPIAQGLPWTTDEPECLVKPPVKESTRPVDLQLHSDLRAVERAEFDHHVAEKLSFIEQYRLEREKQLKLAEEEEIRRLRRELVPKAQPMPYFDRPFIPRRSLKHPTVPKEPKFHIPQHKKIKCMSWNDMNMNIYTHQLCESYKRERMNGEQ
ncbi:reticulocyte-binding protein 2 homolog a-like [Macadamia integrifolia]|uniref:reticulocyte-binding protein 2 homolog a-like n=1 Tax=Macadamia integrifolia TaxID=60698 RepID=UPI001C501212|nr:reticulocyte-binding protein 2 homolog a-like [Macadamia integrifolia]